LISEIVQVPFFAGFRMKNQFFLSNYQWFLNGNEANLLYNNKAIINIQLTFN